jgi:hypothetical protein
VVLRRQVIVGEIVEGEAPYLAAHGVVVSEPVELVQPASELADASQVDVVQCGLGYLSLRLANRGRPRYSISDWMFTECSALRKLANLANKQNG